MMSQTFTHDIYESLGQLLFSLSHKSNSIELLILYAISLLYNYFEEIVFPPTISLLTSDLDFTFRNLPVGIMVPCSARDSAKNE